MSAQICSRQSLRSGPEAKAIENWVRRDLSDRFDDTLAEDVPGDLAALAMRFGG